MELTLGWNTSDELTGVIRELSEKNPTNVIWGAMYKYLASGSNAPLILKFDDDAED